jgi:hypothetical protein
MSTQFEFGISNEHLSKNDTYLEREILKVPKRMSLSRSLLEEEEEEEEEETYSEFIGERKADSFGVPRIYAIDNIHGQKYSTGGL